MNSLLSSLMAMSISGSIVVVIIILLRPITSKLFSAKWQYGVGKIAISFFIIPFFLLTGGFIFGNSFTDNTPPEVFNNQVQIPVNNIVDDINRTTSNLIKEHLPHKLNEIIFSIWFIGFVFFGGWHLYCYKRFTKQLKANNFLVTDSEMISLFSRCKRELGIHRDVGLMVNSKISSPMLVGLHRPTVLLPPINIKKENLKLIFTHELLHLKHKDLWVKGLSLIASAFHWFNPFVHFVRKDIRTWGELACDEAVVLGLSSNERKLYGETILHSLENQHDINTAFCSSLCEDRKHIRRRLIMILKVQKMKKHIAVLSAVTVISIVAIGGTVSALAAPNTTEIETLDYNISDNSDEKRDADKFIKEEQKPQPRLKEYTEKNVDTADDIIMPFGTDSLISVSHSDEHKFTSEEWEDILSKIEKGELRWED